MGRSQTCVFTYHIDHHAIHGGLLRKTEHVCPHDPVTSTCSNELVNHRIVTVFMLWSTTAPPFKKMLNKPWCPVVSANYSMPDLVAS